MFPFRVSRSGGAGGSTSGGGGPKSMSSSASAASNTSDDHRSVSTAYFSSSGWRRGSAPEIGDETFGQDDLIYEEREKGLQAMREAVTDLLNRFELHRKAVVGVVESSRDLSNAVANLYSSRHPYYDVALRHQKTSQDVSDILLTTWERQMQAQVEAGLRQKLPEFTSIKGDAIKREKAKEEVARRARKVRALVQTDPSRVRDNEKKLREARSNYRLFNEEILHRVTNLEQSVEKLIFPMVRDMAKLNSSVARQISDILEEMSKFAEEFSPSDRLYASSVSERGSIGNAIGSPSLTARGSFSQSRGADLSEQLIEKWDEADFGNPNSQDATFSSAFLSPLSRILDSEPTWSGQRDDPSISAEPPVAQSELEEEQHQSGKVDPALKTSSESSIPIQSDSRTQPRRSKAVLSRVRVLHDYEPQGPHEMALHAGDVVDVLRKDESGWWHGTCGRIGFFPATFTRPLTDEEEGLYLSSKIRNHRTEDS